MDEPGDVWVYIQRRYLDTLIAERDLLKKQIDRLVEELQQSAERAYVMGEAEPSKLVLPDGGEVT